MPLKPKQSLIFSYQAMKMYFLFFALLFLLPSAAKSQSETPTNHDPFYPFHPEVRHPFSSSNLPILVIDLDTVMAKKEEDRRIPARMKIVYRSDNARNEISDTAASNLANPAIINYNGRVGIKYRGNYSYLGSPKKPFSVRTENSEGSKQEVDILGLGADSDWALLAPYNDQSMIRDILTFELFRDYFDYTPRGKYCELVLNGVYQGVYIVTARVKRGTTRLNLPKPKASGDGLTGGYHLEVDRQDEAGFLQSYPCLNLYGDTLPDRPYYQFKYPDIDDYNGGMTAQKDYITRHMYNFETVMASDNYQNPETGYRKYLDVLSVIDYMLAQEFTHNVDAYCLSTPIYKYPDSVDPRFKMSIWDFNVSLGNGDYRDSWSPEGWVWNASRFGVGHPFWFKRLLADPLFKAELKTRWYQYRKANMTFENIEQKIDSLVLLLTEGESRNAQTWKNWQYPVWPNYYISTSWDDEIDFLKRFIRRRVQWIDSQFEEFPKNLIANATFDCDDTRGANNPSILLSNWMLIDSTSQVSYTTENPKSAPYALSISQGGIHQTVTELPNGMYALKIWARTVGDPNARMIVKYHDTDRSKTLSYAIPNSEEFTEISFPNIKVTSGICDIHFQTEIDGQQARLDIDDISFFDANGPYEMTSSIPAKRCMVYPTLFKEHVTVEFSPLSNRTVFNLYSSTGTLVNRFITNETPNTPAKIRWNLNHPGSLPAGMYFYQIQDGNHVECGKLIKP